MKGNSKIKSLVSELLPGEKQKSASVDVTMMSDHVRNRAVVWAPRPNVALFVRVRVRLRVGRLGPSKGGLQLALGLNEQCVGYYGRVGHRTEQRQGVP